MKTVRVLFALIILLAVVFNLASCASPIASGACGKDNDELNWSLSAGGVLTITGAGEMMDYSFDTPAPWFEYRDSIINITFSNGVAAIGTHAFWGCRNITSIQLPDNLVSIADDAFSHCDSLAEITIPDSITFFGDGVFSRCPNLTRIALSQNHPFLQIVNGVLFSKPDQRLIWYPVTSAIETYDIPDGTRSIAGSAFFECRQLLSVTLPDSLVSIGDAAFCGCGGLTGITIPNSVQTIGKWAFEDCVSLTSVSFPEGIELIGDYAFAYCHSLTSVNLPESIRFIGEGTFYYCSNLTVISFPNKLQSIGSRAFHLCENLSEVKLPDCLTYIGDFAFIGCGFSEITLPDSVTIVGNNPFADCIKLKTITVSSLNPNLCVVDGVLFSSDDMRLVCYPANLEAELYHVPNGIQVIDSCAFSRNFHLHMIYLPDSIKSIGADAFFGCENLTFSVEKGSYAEQYCVDKRMSYLYSDN